MAVNLLTPNSSIDVRNLAPATGQTIYTGRWALLSAAGEATLAGIAAKAGYFIWEGISGFKDGVVAGDFDVAGVPAAGKTFEYPSNKAANRVAAAYGIFRASVGPEGFVLGTLAVGDGLELDAAGRLVKLDAGVRVATVEAVSATELTFKTVAVA